MKTTAHLLTGDTVATEIEWSVAATVSNDYEVELGEVTGAHTDTSAAPIGPLDFDEWRELHGITRRQLDALTESAIEHYREALIERAAARADDAYDRSRERAR